MVMQPDVFEQLLTIARAHHVEEFSVGELAVKFAPRPGPALKEKKELPPVRDALSVALEGANIADADTVEWPDGIGEQTKTGVQWANDDPTPPPPKE
jgi:hypothetical protein